MPETQKSEAQSPERTDAGIYAGVEKYTKEDDPKDNVAYDPATGEQTGAGMPPSTQELSHRSETDGKETIGHEPSGSHAVDRADKAASSVQSPDEVTGRAVVPAPAPTREHLIENYPHVFPNLEKKAAAEAEKKEAAEKKAAEAEDQSTSSSDSDTNKEPSHPAESSSSEKKTEKHHKKDHKKHHAHDKETTTDEDGHAHRGPIKAVAHALHLDRHDRKLEKEQKEEEEKEMKERKRNIRKRNERLLNGVNELTQTEETSHLEDAGDGGPPKGATGTTDGGAVSDARAVHDAIPLEVLNPEMMERKAKEDELIERGGDFQELAQKPKEETSIPSDRIDNLIEREHARIKAGLPVEKGEENLKVAFHTADSFDRLDKAAISSK